VASYIVAAASMAICVCTIVRVFTVAREAWIVCAVLDHLALVSCSLLLVGASESAVYDVNMLACIVVCRGLETWTLVTWTKVGLDRVLHKSVLYTSEALDRIHARISSTLSSALPLLAEYRRPTVNRLYHAARPLLLAAVDCSHRITENIAFSTVITVLPCLALFGLTAAKSRAYMYMYMAGNLFIVLRLSVKALSAAYQSFVKSRHLADDIYDARDIIVFICVSAF